MSALTFTPRWYQTECVQGIINYFMSGGAGNPIAELPTGSGKSLVIAMLLEYIFRHWPNQRVLMLTHSKELISQNANTLLKYWPSAPMGINSAGLGRRDIHKRIVFGGIGSVAKHAEKFGHVDLVLIDEAHLVSHRSETQYRKFIAELKAINPAIKVIGFTATPWRVGVGHIADPEDKRNLFSAVAYSLINSHNFLRLIDEGYLSMLIPRKMRTEYDLSGVKTVGGDYKEDELQKVMDRDEVTYEALRETIEAGEDRKHWLIFATGVEHAKHIQGMLSQMGIPCGMVHGAMESGVRDSELAKFASGEYRAMVNANVLTIGYDFPALDMIVILRPTKSTTLHCQILGRGLRVFPGKQNCLVLDFAGNTMALGPINDPVIPRKKGQKSGEAPCKICPHCNTIVYASAKTCFHCGHEFPPPQTKLQTTASDAPIIKVGLEPIVEVFKVDTITYSEHIKAGSPPSVQVAYQCGAHVFREWVCPEHIGFPAKKARDWWKLRSPHPMPESAAELLEYVGELPVPTHLRVWVNAKFPEIKATCFDGTAFGTCESDGQTANIVLPAKHDFSQFNKGEKVDLSEYDDDIPF